MMPVDLKNLYISLIIIYGVLFPCFAANFDPKISSVIFKSYILILFIVGIILVKRTPKDKLKFTAKSFASIFFLFLVVDSIITIISAGSTLSIIKTNMIYIAVFFITFLIPALLSEDLPVIPLRIITTFVLIIALGSIIVDFAGYGSEFAGKYVDLLPEKYGLKQLHGFMPWPNSLATLLLVDSLLLQIVNPKSSLAKVGLISTLVTFTRAHIVTAFLLLIFSVSNRKLKIIIFSVMLFASITYLPAVVKDSLNELNIEKAESVYRLTYIIGAAKALSDYPLFGVGLNRLSNDYIWKIDNCKFHKRYSLPTELFGTSMASSDTNITFFAEIGMLGILLYFIQLFYFVKLSITHKCYSYIYILLPQMLLAYSFPTILFSFTYGSIYWFLYGNLIAKDYNCVHYSTVSRAVK